MNDDDKKLLTEFLGQCWHESNRTGRKPWDYSTCKSCGALYKDQYWDRRTFTTWQDLGDLKGALVEKGLYADFYMHCTRMYKQTRTINWKWVDESSVSSWLYLPARFCQLVADFIREDNHV